MAEQRFSDNEPSRRDIPSFIEPRPPLIQNPFMRPRPQKGLNLLEQFEEDSEIEEPELVQVYLRIKPCEVPNNLYEVRSDKCLVTSLDTTTAGHGRRTQHNVSRMYTFSHIFRPESTQKEVFDQVVKENLKKLPDGHSFTLLTYGASGSGKTYTLMGTVGSPGLVPRALEYVFKLVDAAQMPLYKPSDTGADQLSYAAQDSELQWVKRLRQVSAPHRDKYRRMSTQLLSDMTVSNVDLSNRTKYYVWVSFVEIYNEAIYDLLAPPEKRTKLRIREDSSGNVYVKGVRQAFVRSGSEAYDVMAAGRHSLVVAATGVHAHSSRSHCIFTISMLTERDGEISMSHVRLCDLAGSERQRAAATSGARMLESRAINSSLHVLERCLHMLRRKQRMLKETPLVPYRESKLTRLLGSGLSGCRGEGVSMVVTLNPAPHFLHETKHVLALAAVAQDIQINNTMYASTFESSASQDTTINNSTALMQLRSDNERLRFELLQEQARNKELLASMEENQQKTADTMREYVEETKDMMKRFYEAQMNSLRTEMSDMREEYESLAKSSAAANGAGTPSRYLQAKVAQLMTEIAVLEDQLSEEKLARARAEKEVQHLQTCIEERDDKAFMETAAEKEEVLSESFNESDEEPSDPFNESMEPVFMRECVHSKSQTVNKSLDHLESKVDDTGNETMDNTLNNDEKLNDTLKNDSVLSVYDTGDEEEVLDDKKQVQNVHESMDDFSLTNDDKNDKQLNFKVDLNDHSAMNNSNTEKDKSEVEEMFHESTELHETEDDIKRDAIPYVRGTYFVKNEQKEDITVKSFAPRGYFVDASSLDHKVDIQDANVNETESKSSEVIKPKKVSETLVKKIIKSIKTNESTDNSLNQFEQLEMAANNCDVDNSKNISNDFGNIKILKEKRTYFDVNDDVSLKTDKPLDKITTSRVKNDDKTDVLTSVIKQEKPIPIPSHLVDEPKANILSSAAKVQEQQLYFDEEKINSDEVLISRSGMEKRTYFDNIDPVVEPARNNNVKDIMIASIKDEARSPSIVKDDLDKDYKPSTIKKLIRESYVSDNMMSSINKQAIIKKHDSLDLFESPQIIAKDIDNIEKVSNKEAEENIKIASPTKVKELSNIDVVRKSIERLVLEQKTKANIKQDTKESTSTKIQDTNSEIMNNTASAKKSPVKIEDKINVTATSTTLNNTQTIKENNTIDEFDNIYKDLSNVRVTEFELLVTQDINTCNTKDNTMEQDVADNKVNEEKETVQIDKVIEKETVGQKDEDIIYNLRSKGSRRESKATTVKRCLRLRRRRNVDEDNSDQDNESKLKDIINLKQEFSDVTMEIPAIKKEFKDIPSPEKLPGEDENLPPMMGIQSCPSKSVTRSRRKLFTPRAEPLDESPSQTGESNERLYVPRPSYHRTIKSRRKLL